MELASIVGIAAGAGALVLGLLLVFTENRSMPKRESRPAMHGTRITTWTYTGPKEGAPKPEDWPAIIRAAEEDE